MALAQAKLTFDLVPLLSKVTFWKRHFDIPPGALKSGVCKEAVHNVSKWGGQIPFRRIKRTIADKLSQLERWRWFRRPSQ